MNDPRYRVILTGDGTPTLYNQEYGEAMHSMSGAYEESVVKHIDASDIFKSGKKRITILDTGFGLGYNILAVLEKNHYEHVFEYIEIISLEIDRTIDQYFDSISFEGFRGEIYHDILDAYKHGTVQSATYGISLLFGDARKSIRTLEIKEVKFDAVFHDAYSPGKNPELWTCDYFTLVRSLMKNDAILTTYSAAPQVRMALINAGFRIGRVPSTGEKKEGTIAFIDAQRIPFSDEEIDELRENVKSTVYRDETFDSCREKILMRRIEEMRKIREDRRALRE
jgi:tRNA U34 5-methylaminomethyl-2-thiouridine-forming methyltransferase MnmC